MSFKYLFLMSLFAITTWLQGITINLSIEKQAHIDIFFSKEPLNNKPFLHNVRIVAEYSLLITQQNKVYLWKNIHKNPLDLLIRPIYHISIPQQITSPYTIEIAPEELQELLGNSSQVYVTIKQRNYEYNSSMNDIVVFKNNILAQSFYDLDAHIVLEARGLIAPEKFELVPLKLRNKYPVAFGLVH